MRVPRVAGRWSGRRPGR